MKKVVVLTGAGVSADSGISTFRDNGGLWEEYDVMEVATPEAWAANQNLVLDFYNKRRSQLATVLPNAAHKALAELEQKAEVHIITQNVDDLHERAGSTNILHLHGELTKVRSTIDDTLIYDWGYNELTTEHKCDKGSQLRPHIVWFGEWVPNIDPAQEITAQADILLVIGTSLNVYPAAGLINFVKPNTPIYAIDPQHLELSAYSNAVHIRETAAKATPTLLEELFS